MMISFQQDECPNPLASLLFTNAKNAAEAEWRHSDEEPNNISQQKTAGNIIQISLSYLRRSLVKIKMILDNIFYLTTNTSSNN